MPSATVHARFVSLATRLIDKHGRDASLVAMTNSGSDFDPILAETVTPVVIVQTGFDSSEIDGDLVRAGDLRFLMDSSVAPTNDMRLRDGTTDYSIVPIQEVKPGMVSIIYKVQARI